jgi:glyoxylase-like metal-dependent hydrolase (beta-lactamase superfamily II)
LTQEQSRREEGKVKKRNALKVGFLSCVAFIAITSATSVAQQTPAERAAYFLPQDWPIKTIRKDKVYMIPGGGDTTTVIIGDTGVIVVDPKVNKATGEQLLKKIAALTPKPVTHVSETHSDCDHVNGIVAFPNSVQIIAHINNRKEQEQVARLATVEINGGYGVGPQDRLPNILITKNG